MAHGSERTPTFDPCQRGQYCEERNQTVGRGLCPDHFFHRSTDPTCARRGEFQSTPTRRHETTKRLPLSDRPIGSKAATLGTELNDDRSRLATRIDRLPKMGKIRSDQNEVSFDKRLEVVSHNASPAPFQNQGELHLRVKMPATVEASFRPDPLEGQATALGGQRDFFELRTHWGIKLTILPIECAHFRQYKFSIDQRLGRRQAAIPVG